MMAISSISIDPKIMGGKPVITGTRITIEHILELLSGGWSEEHIVKEYPHLTRDAIRDALRYATALTRDESVFPLPTTPPVGSYEVARG